jgi:hypothetical protein
LDERKTTKKMYDSRSETGGPCATQSAMVRRNGWKLIAPGRLTTAWIGSIGDVVKRERKGRVVDLHRYHDAIDAVKSIYIPED